LWTLAIDCPGEGADPPDNGPAEAEVDGCKSGKVAMAAGVTDGDGNGIEERCCYCEDEQTMLGKGLAQRQGDGQGNYEGSSVEDRFARCWFARGHLIPNFCRMRWVVEKCLIAREKVPIIPFAPSPPRETAARSKCLDRAAKGFSLTT
jgi:hypothetical protein